MYELMGLQSTQSLLSQKKEKERPLFEQRMDNYNGYLDELNEEKEKIKDLAQENEEIQKDIYNNMDKQLVNI